MISLKNETMQQIITDIMGKGCEWKPNYGVAEGYRFNVGKTIHDIGYPNFLIDRLRIRLNTVERIQYTKHLDQDALRSWRFAKINTPYWELRIYDEACSPFAKYPCVKDVRLFEEMTANHRDGYMSLAEYMLMRAYEKERGDNPTGDLLEDFAQDMELQDESYARSEHLYLHIGRRACEGCMEALDEMVTDYRKYCKENGLEYDAFQTWAEEEAEYDGEDDE